MVRACFPYFLCTSMLTFYAVKIGRVRFFAKKLDRARAELAIVPIPIMQIIVVVMFAFVMMHVQEILIPFDCQPCGRERWGGDKGPENAAFEVDVFCLAKTSQIICGESEHVFMKVVSYFLLLLLMAYAGALMKLIKMAYDWQRDPNLGGKGVTMPWWICGIAFLVEGNKGFKEDAGWGAPVFTRMYEAMTGDNWVESTSYWDFYKKAFIPPPPTDNEEEEDDAARNRSAPDDLSSLGSVEREELQKMGITIYHVPEDASSLDSFEHRKLSDKGVVVHKRKKAEKEEEDDFEAEEGTFWQMSYMIWGLFILMDLPLQLCATLFSRQTDIALFSQSMCIATQCVLLAFFRPFNPEGVNYFIIVASFLNFLMGCSAAFVELFRKYTFSPAGQNGNVYIPRLEFLCNP